MNLDFINICLRLYKNLCCLAENTGTKTTVPRKARNIVQLWPNQPQSFTKDQVWSGTSHWICFGFLIFISGIRKVLQNQEVHLMDAKCINQHF